MVLVVAHAEIAVAVTAAAASARVVPAATVNVLVLVASTTGAGIRLLAVVADDAAQLLHGPLALWLATAAALQLLAKAVHGAPLRPRA